MEDILESIRQVEQYMTGLSQEAFFNQPMVQDAVGCVQSRSNNPYGEAW